MAFFDDLGKKISSASQSAVQKTKEMAEIAKLNSQISDEEKKLNSYYSQIGKLYIQIHRNDFGAEFAELMTAVKQSEDKIVSCKKTIEDVKGIARCVKCGAEIPSTAAFCNACGEPVAKQAQPAPVENNPTPVVNNPAPQNSKPVVTCSGCGAVVPDNMRFCTSCGTPVGGTAPVAAPAPAQPAGKKCPNCGAVAAEGMAFCTECGANLS